MAENNEKVSVDKIKKYHKIIMENLIENNGEFKKAQNIILGANFETAKPYQVPTILQEWCDNLNYRLELAQNDKEKLEVILSEHIKFEKIHPFSDGNGRTGRILIIDICVNNNLVPVIIPKEAKGKYIYILNNENEKEFLEWGLELQKAEKRRKELFENKEK